MNKQQIINELLKDNPPINSTKATEHISEMEIFQMKINEEMEKLSHRQQEIMQGGINNSEETITKDTGDFTGNTSTSEDINRDSDGDILTE